MTVESFLELYLAIFGWRQYGNIWEILTTTRLVYFPILAIIFTNITQPLMSQEAKGAVVTSVKRMEVQIILLILVIILVLVPFLTLDSGVLEYNKPCDTAFGPAGTFQAGSTGTTYDPVLGDFVTTSVEVPIWWRLWMAVFSGISRQAIAEIGCADDVSGLRIRISKERIRDEDLAHELHQFVQYCYRPALAKWQREGRSLEQEGLTDLPADDTQWPGSQAFLTVAGFYDTYRPREGIGGWAYDPGRDTEYPPELIGEYDTENIGRPFCNEWWPDLSERLVASVEPDLLTQVRGILPGFFPGGLTQEDVDEQVLRGLVSTSLAAAPAGNSFVPSLNDEDVFSLERLAAGLGVDIEEFRFRPMIYAARTALPIIQALILGAFYALVGIAIVIGGLSFSSVITLTIVLFTIKFWSVLWHWAWFLEQSLVAVLYPDGASYVQSVITWRLSSNYLVGGDFALKLQILEFSVLLMFIVFPMIFTFMLGLVGVGAIAGLTYLSAALLGPVQAGSQRAVDTARSVSTSLGSGAIGWAKR